MIKKVTFLKDFRCFKEGEVINFVQRYKNRDDEEIEYLPKCIPLVGLNGSGKTTLLHLLSNHFKGKEGGFGGLKYAHRREQIIEVEHDGEPKVRLFEAEIDIKRGTPAFDWDDKDITVQNHIQAFHMSHGEAVINALCALIAKLPESGYNLLLLDEPDQALSIQLAYYLGKMLLHFETKHPDVQVITAIHHPVVMEQLMLLYSVKDRKYRWHKDVVEEMKETPLGET